MYDADQLIELFFDNVKHFLFPESWLQFDLKFSKFEIFSMLLVDKKKEITMTELSEYIETPMSTANGIIERLVKKGYIQRDRSETDRRIVVLRLTQKGTELVGSLKEVTFGYLKLALDSLSDEEVRTLIELVLKVINGFHDKLRSGEEQPVNELKRINIE